MDDKTLKRIKRSYQQSKICEGVAIHLYRYIICRSFKVLNSLLLDPESHRHFVFPEIVAWQEFPTQCQCDLQLTTAIRFLL